MMTSAAVPLETLTWIVIAARRTRVPCTPNAAQKPPLDAHDSDLVGYGLTPLLGDTRRSDHAALALPSPLWPPL
jgi:hypothetical protein